MTLKTNKTGLFGITILGKSWKVQRSPMGYVGVYETKAEAARAHDKAMVQAVGLVKARQNGLNIDLDGVYTDPDLLARLTAAGVTRPYIEVTVQHNNTPGPQAPRPASPAPTPTHNTTPPRSPAPTAHAVPDPAPTTAAAGGLVPSRSTDHLGLALFPPAPLELQPSPRPAQPLPEPETGARYRSPSFTFNPGLTPTRATGPPLSPTPAPTDDAVVPEPEVQTQTEAQAPPASPAPKKRGRPKKSAGSGGLRELMGLFASTPAPQASLWDEGTRGRGRPPSKKARLSVEPTPPPPAPPAAPVATKGPGETTPTLVPVKKIAPSKPTPAPAPAAVKPPAPAPSPAPKPQPPKKSAVQKKPTAVTAAAVVLTQLQSAQAKTPAPAPSPGPPPKKRVRFADPESESDQDALPSSPSPSPDLTDSDDPDVDEDFAPHKSGRKGKVVKAKKTTAPSTTAPKHTVIPVDSALAAAQGLLGLTKSTTAPKLLQAASATVLLQGVPPPPPKASTSQDSVSHAVQGYERAVVGRRVSVMRPPARTYETGIIEAYDVPTGRHRVRFPATTSTAPNPDESESTWLDFDTCHVIMLPDIASYDDLLRETAEAANNKSSKSAKDSKEGGRATKAVGPEDVIGVVVYVRDRELSNAPWRRAWVQGYDVTMAAHTVTFEDGVEESLELSSGAYDVVGAPEHETASLLERFKANLAAAKAQAQAKRTAHVQKENAPIVMSGGGAKPTTAGLKVPPPSPPRRVKTTSAGVTVQADPALLRAVTDRLPGNPLYISLASLGLPAHAPGVPAMLMPAVAHAVREVETPDLCEGASRRGVSPEVLQSLQSMARRPRALVEGQLRGAGCSEEGGRRMVEIVQRSCAMLTQIVARGGGTFGAVPF